ncbi:protein FAM180A-like [Spinachia spinachia]
MGQREGERGRESHIITGPGGAGKRAPRTDAVRERQGSKSCTTREGKKCERSGCKQAETHRRQRLRVPAGARRPDREQAAMLPRRMAIVGLFYFGIRAGVTHYQSNALFPAGGKIKRGLSSVVIPTFHSSFEDVHLLFEILLTGVTFEAGGEFSVQDAELASLRKTRSLEVICEESVPKKLSDVVRLIAGLSHHIGHLHQEDFERTLLTLVYTSQAMVNSSNEHQRSMWAESFVSLYKAIKLDLTGKR